MTKGKVKDLLNKGFQLNGNVNHYYYFESNYYHDCWNGTCFGSENNFEDFWDLIKGWENWAKFNNKDIIPPR